MSEIKIKYFSGDVININGYMFRIEINNNNDYTLAFMGEIKK